MNTPTPHQGRFGHGALEKVAALLLALAPPAVVGGWLWGNVRRSPVLSILLLLLYWLGLIGIRFAGRVGATLSDRWVPKVADAVDRAVSATIGGYRVKYEEQLASSVRDVELAGLGTQGEYALRLHHVYVDVSLVPRPLRETAREPFLGALNQLSERRALESFLAGTEPTVLAIIGGPGSGKTTLLRYTAYELCRKGFRRRSLPVLLYLRQHVPEITQDPALRLATTLAEVGWLKGKVPTEWLERRLESGRCLVMFDGLDEVADESERQQVVAWVKLQIERFPANDYVITSRPYGYLSNPLNNANVLQVRRFTARQISQFIREWYYAIECRSTGEEGELTRIRSGEKAEGLLHRLRNQAALYDLAANPLLLTMIANVHKYRGALPGSRAALYGEMCQVLLHRRQEAKGLTAQGTGLRSEQKERVVRKLAVEMMARRVRDISVKDARLAIGPALRRVSHNVDPMEFLTEVEKSGLLVEREVGSYAFAHLTLQEYLAAVEGRELQRADLLANWVDDLWWRETILLWAADADATSIIEACLRSGSVRALALAIDCAEEAREIQPEVRARLQHLLDSAQFQNSLDDSRRRLITGARVAQALRDVVWLSGDIAVCARPVRSEIYVIFQEETRRLAGSGEPSTEHNDVLEESGAAVGMSASDAGHFVIWVNSLFNDGTVHRLPTPAELDDPAIDLVADLNRLSVWAQQGETPTLYCKAEAPNPYLPDPDLVRRTFTLDRERTSDVALATLSYALERDAPRALNRYLYLSKRSIVDVIEDLYGGARYVGTRHAGYQEAREFDHTKALKRAVDDVRSNTVKFQQALVNARALARILHRYDPETDRTNSDHVSDLAGLLEQDGALSSALDDPLDGILNHALDAQHFQALARELDEPETTWETLDGTTQTRTAFRILVLSYSVLLQTWIARRGNSGGGDELKPFDEFLATLLKVQDLEAVLPEGLGSTVDEAEQMLAGRQGDSTPYEGMRLIAERIVQDVRAVLPATLSARTVLDHNRMATARIGLLGAIVAAEQVPHADRAVSLLRQSVQCLVALEGRARGDIAPNEVILLVRPDR